MSMEELLQRYVVLSVHDCIIVTDDYTVAAIGCVFVLGSKNANQAMCVRLQCNYTNCWSILSEPFAVMRCCLNR